MHSPQAFVAPNASVSSPGPLAPSSAFSPQIVIPKSSLANPHSRAAYPEQYLQQGHPYRRAPTHNSPAPSSTPTPTSTSTYQGHIASTIASSAAVAQQQSTSPPPFFSARTSSLLPPPHLTAKRSSPTTPTAHIPPALQSNPNANYPYADLPPLSETDPSASTRRPSRSSSVSGVAGDSVRNLNRWSASTTSSHASNPAFQRNLPAGGRRMSVDAVALQARSTTAPPPPSYAAPTYNSPRKLQKSRRPSTASGDSLRAPASATTARPYSPAPIGPLESLPPIVALPSLEQEVRAGTPSLADRSLANRPPLLRQASANASDLSGHATSTSRGSESATAEEPASPRSRMQMRAVAGNAMAIDRNGDGKGHARHRSQGGKGSSDSAKNRERSKPSQKAMLSRALEKANTAVQLDNAGNVEGARAAYSEACDLLHQVLVRTSGDDDRKKLEEIRKTYTTRIDELDQLEAPTRRDGRPLPTRPESRTRGPNRTSEDSQEWPSGLRGEIEAALDGDDMMDPRATASSYAIKTSTGNRMRQDSSVSMRNGLDVPRTGAATPQMRDQYSLQSSFSRSPGANERMARLDVEHPMQNQYMPPPLSPRRPPSPRRAVQPSPEHFRADYSMTSERRPSVSGSDKGHTKANSQESISWLDPIDESGGSDVSSVHSRSASMGVRRKHIRAASGDTEAEFDAALDDAIEAAYDDGYEPMDPNEVNKYGDDDEDVVARALKKVQLARERVKESEREALALANEQEKRLRQQLEEEDEEGGNFYDGNESEEEERMLEEMTTGYAIEEFAFGLGQKKPGFPRESDSSELTSRTWHSSTGSNPPTATTILSTVSENTVVPDAAKSAVPSIPPPPPPASSLPKLPPQAKGAKSAANADTVRDRRLSGQNPKQLKIETSKIGPPPGSLTGPVSAAQPKAGGFIVQQRQALSAGPNRVPPPFSRHGPSPVPGDMAPPPTPPLPQGEYDPRSGSPSLSRQGLRKNFSSSSLKSMKTRNMSLSNLDDASDMSPGTPHSNQFGAASRLPAMPNLPTPVATAFKDRMMTNGGTGGLHLFDSDFHSPASPGSPNPLYADAPVPLESCPTDSMLRPFWLMRCLFQTLVHPRGGYISNKLFVPQDVWKVRNVKLKNVEDKVANCDLLTAALMNLAKVDTCDADAVLEEMQSLENVLEQVQLALARKLGNEVGVNHTSTMFKDASSGLDAETGTNSGSAAARSGSVSGKTSSGFSWRRLRSKNSSSGLNSGYSGGGALARKDSIPENSAAMAREAVLPSLPMTSHPTSRPSKRDLAGVQFTGPQAHYMASLARLFDAAQAVDQIARQVEDPGLRHADKTQVGLELCTRHAAEFFGFYICRFVLADLTMLLDKFMKRGSEWVLV